MNASHDGPAPQPTTERYVYSVPSDRNPNVKYRVDLVANSLHMQASEKNPTLLRPGTDARSRETRKQAGNGELLAACAFSLIVAGLLSFILYHAANP
jgi:hypothetical protein